MRAGHSIARPLIGLLVLVSSGMALIGYHIAVRSQQDSLAAELILAFAMLLVATLLGTWLTRGITERKLAEVALRESEAKFRSLTNLSSDGYWEQDESGRFVATADRRPGLSTFFTLVGQRPWEDPASQPVSGTWDSHQATLAARQAFRNFRIRRLDDQGQERFISVSGEPVFAADGEFRGYRGIARDVTARMRAEQDAARAHRFRSAVIDAVPSPIFVKDEGHRWIFLNEAMATSMGRPREDLIGKSEFDVFPRAEAEAVKARDNLVFATGVLEEHEESFTDAGGAAHWILTRKRAYELSADKHVLVGVITDITERRSAETSLKNAMEAAEAANRAKSEFVAT